MKKILPFMAIILLMAACTTDAYDSGDGELSFLRADFVEVHTNNEALVFSATTDDDEVLNFGGNYKISWATVKDTTYRALLYYNKVGSDIEPFSLSAVIVPDIKPVGALKEGMKIDPVSIESCWRSANDSYLNLSLNMKSGKDDDNSKHVVGMMCDTLMQQATGKKHLHLLFYHDQNGLPEYYTTKSYISIPLKKNPYQLGTGDTISITVNTYDGKVVKTFIY